MFVCVCVRVRARVYVCRFKYLYYLCNVYGSWKIKNLSDLSIYLWNQDLLLIFSDGKDIHAYNVSSILDILIFGWICKYILRLFFLPDNLLPLTCWLFSVSRSPEYSFKAPVFLCVLFLLATYHFVQRRHLLYQWVDPYSHKTFIRSPMKYSFNALSLESITSLNIYVTNS